MENWKKKNMLKKVYKSNNKLFTPSNCHKVSFSEIQLVTLSELSWALFETFFSLVLETDIVLLPEIASQLLARFCWRAVLQGSVAGF